MHENREISRTSCSKEQDRSAKAINQTADMHVPEKSDCAVVPVNQSNREAQASAEAGEGRAQTKENTVQSLGHALPALCRTHVRLNDVLLSLCPSLPSLRGSLRFSVRLVHGYYGTVRLL